MKPLYSILFLLLFIAKLGHAQEDAVIPQAQSYVESRIASMDRYQIKAQKIQQRLLKKLAKHERKLVHSLKKKDSAAYEQYKTLSSNYDSIAHLSDTTPIPYKNLSIDSLKKIQSYAQQYHKKLNAINDIQLPDPIKNQTAKLNELQQQLALRQKVNQLIETHTQSLTQLGKVNNFKKIKQIQKQAYYANEKIKAWKELASDPEEAELKALEFLQGTEGFDRFFNADPNTAWGGLGSNPKIEDLERMGFQTKRQTADLLQQTFGDQLSNVEQNIAGQIQGFTEQLGQVSNTLNDAKGKIKDLQQDTEALKQEAMAAKNLPQQLIKEREILFKKNPEKAKPFLQRLEKQYHFQAEKASPQGKPVLLKFEGALGFKHTQHLSYGIGLNAAIGLGKDWNNIKITYEGLGLLSYIDYKIIYGISIQAGYERTFLPASRIYPNDQSHIEASKDNVFSNLFAGTQQTAYAGLMKRYKINKKWNGTFLIGYNFLWRKSAMASPLLIKIGWAK